MGKGSSGKGFIHIYTGDGKGKTTSAVGLAVRALGHGLKVLYIYFHKDPAKYGYTEISTLEKLGAVAKGFAGSHPGCDGTLEVNEIINQCSQGLEFLRTAFDQKNYDLIILDEIVISVRDKFIEESELIKIIGKKPENTELVMTGRGASDKLMQIADYVSIIEKRKHPYDNGIKSRKGIEF